MMSTGGKGYTREKFGTEQLMLLQLYRRNGSGNYTVYIYYKFFGSNG